MLQQSLICIFARKLQGRQVKI